MNGLNNSYYYIETVVLTQWMIEYISLLLDPAPLGQNGVNGRGRARSVWVLDFRVPVSYSRTIIVFVGIRYKHLRVHDERSESLYT